MITWWCPLEIYNGWNEGVFPGAAQDPLISCWHHSLYLSSCSSGFLGIFFFLSIQCIDMYLCIDKSFVCMSVYTQINVWRPKVDIMCLPWSLSTLFIKIVSHLSLNPGFACLVSQFAPGSWLPPACLLHGFGDQNSGPRNCLTSILYMESFP